MTPKPFAKLDCGITESSIWTQPHDVLRVWIYLLAKCDEYGVVRASPVAVAHQCQITVDRVSEILDILQAPDPYSRTEDHDGKRIMRTDGGWIVLNYALYRDNLLGKPLTAAERKRRQRAREATRDERMSRCVTKRDKCHDVSRNVIEAEAEAEADKEKNNPPSPPLGGSVSPNGFDEFWNAYPRKIGKGAAHKSWKKLRPSQSLQSKILDAVERQRGSPNWTRDNGRYIPNPSTWLNQERWDDEPDSTSRPGEHGDGAVPFG